ncbi:TonB family protein [Puteibacter caeruleilacunae]|nr:TonB family protein [Puteibacter caeruleilacunae]
MKKIVSLLIVLALAICVSGQTTKIHRFLENVDVTPPVFTGIENTADILNETSFKYSCCEDYLKKNIVYPQVAQDYYIQGKVVVEFTVKENGYLDDFEVINSVSEELDEQVIQMVKSTDGMWKPGLNDNMPVAMKKQVQVRFSIGNADHLRMAQKLCYKATKVLNKDRYKRALKLLDRAVALYPHEGSILQRSMARYQAGDTSGACEDWQRLKYSGIEYAREYVADFCGDEDVALIQNDEE